jgi:hypothetical protein
MIPERAYKKRFRRYAALTFFGYFFYKDVAPELLVRSIVLFQTALAM